MKAIGLFGDKPLVVTPTRIENSRVPFQKEYPPSDLWRDDVKALPTAWIVVDSASSRVLDVELDHSPKFAPIGAHYYRLTVEFGGGDKMTVEAVLSDAIRHPVRR